MAAPTGILSNGSRPSPVAANAPPAAPRPFTQRQLDTARHHAAIIQQRKMVEQRVLASIMALIEYPSSPDADPARPSPADARFLTQAVAVFQPNDYDSLIEERNIAGKCGYALCPRPKQQAPSRAKKQFVETSKGVEIVDKKALEVWCSDDCARRALYVKVQLNEEPAWLRAGGHGEEIELKVENAEQHKSLPLRPKKDTATSTVKKEDTEEEDMAAAWAARDDALADLAMERGEKPGRLSRANKELLQENIRERTATAPPQPPSMEDGQSHMAIEGHVPRSGDVGRREDDEDDEEDDEPESWLPR